MKKIIILITCLFFLQACNENNTKIIDNGSNDTTDLPSTVPSDIATTPSKKIPFLKLDHSVFHSVIGWLSNDEILFVLTENGEWTVQSYTLSTEAWKTIYTTSTPIIQGEIHPNKEMILLHTSSNSSSAEVVLLNKNGTVVESLFFESAEIYMNWHPTNPSLLLFSTFYEDWTYNTFVYDGTTQELKAIDVDDPFVKWYDDNRLMVFKWAESSLDGSELHLYSWKDGTVKNTEMNHVLDVQNFKDSMLYVTINEPQEQFEYRLVDKETNDAFEWSSPAVSNYSEWVLPTISFAQKDHIFAIQSNVAGNIDDLKEKSILTEISLNGENRLGEIMEQPLDCSPNGEVCLGGYEKENWIQLHTLKEQKWIELNE